MNAWRCKLFGSIWLAASGCLFPFEGDDGAEGYAEPECTADDQCGHVDLDSDACTIAVCRQGQCAIESVLDGQACQCHDEGDCGAPSGTCEAVSCVDHQCRRTIAPAGAAPVQQAGDCSAAFCDGTSAQAIVEPDSGDLPDDGNACTLDRCGASGPEHEDLPDGEACGNGMCFTGTCMNGCAPANPQSCGDEGPNEPRNNESAVSLARNAPVCGMLDGSDADWYQLFLDDDTLSYDVLTFDFWSTATTLEVCAYVTCGNGGFPGGGCATKLPGPNGSQGCCWQGAPAQLDPSWDLDCTGTAEDGGTAYIRVRAPGGSACEQYAMRASY
jgi:hypothetical protein